MDRVSGDDIAIQVDLWEVSGNILAISQVPAPAWNKILASREVFADSCCNPARGAGADNVVCLKMAEPSNVPVVKCIDMLVLEPTGEIAALCGNGLGCAACQLSIETKAFGHRWPFLVHGELGRSSDVAGECFGDKDGNWHFRAHLGRSRSGVDEYIVLPTTDKGAVLEIHCADVGFGDGAACYFTVVGEPHLVAVIPGARSLAALPVVPSGANYWERGQTPRFPHGTNIMITTDLCDGSVYYRPFERNGRYTGSCSTGVAAILCVLGHRERVHDLGPVAFYGPGASSALSSFIPRTAAEMRARQVSVTSSARHLGRLSVRICTPRDS